MLPKLWSTFKNGGSGNATVIYPNLLPFLGKIPTDIIGEDTGFYKAWFENMKQGYVHIIIHQKIRPFYIYMDTELHV